VIAPIDKPTRQGRRQARRPADPISLHLRSSARPGIEPNPLLGM